MSFIDCVVLDPVGVPNGLPFYNITVVVSLAVLEKGFFFKQTIILFPIL